MSSFRMTREAEQDLFDVWSHIAVDSVDAADRVETELYAACRSAYIRMQVMSGRI